MTNGLSLIWTMDCQWVGRASSRAERSSAQQEAREEILSISQPVTSLRSLRFSRQVRAFTEHGAPMAATVLNSPWAIKMSFFIIRQS
jgi:hypothetical protein